MTLNKVNRSNCYTSKTLGDTLQFQLHAVCESVKQHLQTSVRSIWQLLAELGSGTPPGVAEVVFHDKHLLSIVYPSLIMTRCDFSSHKINERRWRGRKKHTNIQGNRHIQFPESPSPKLGTYNVTSPDHGGLQQVIQSERKIEENKVRAFASFSFLGIEKQRCMVSTLRPHFQQCESCDNCSSRQHLFLFTLTFLEGIGLV